MGRLMGLDVGTQTIGVAISDPTRMLASPDRTIRRQSVAKDVAAIAEIVRARAIEGVIVGLPYELEGGERRSAKLARQIGEAVITETGLPVTYIDERFTSVEAEQRMRAAGMSSKKRAEIIDQAAAALILQSYLDHGDWTQDERPR
jgi:putative Holliday junction resolvase